MIKLAASFLCRKACSARVNNGLRFGEAPRVGHVWIAGLAGHGNCGFGDVYETVEEMR